MNAVYVAIAKISLVLDNSHSLKEKRMVLRRIKDRVRERVGVTVNEVGEHDVWQRAELGVAITSADRQKAIAVLDSVINIVVGAGGAEIIAIARDISTFAGEAVPYVPVDDRTGAADKAQGQGDADWIPDEWVEEAHKP